LFGRKIYKKSFGFFQVRQVLEEMRSLYEQNQQEIEESRQISPAIHLRHASLERNRRCLLAYINHRSERIREMRWQFGAVLPPEIKSNLCEPEVAFFSKYSRDIANYMRSIGDGAGLDLMTDLHPPKALYIEVSHYWPLVVKGIFIFSGKDLLSTTF
jgi:GINS complex subunit 1